MTSVPQPTPTAVHAGPVAPSGLGPLANVLIALIGLYRAVPRSGLPRCRFAPTCSSYAAEAIRTHGAGRGSWLAVRRVLRCHPLHPGGIDRVPDVRADARRHPRQGVGS